MKTIKSFILFIMLILSLIIGYSYLFFDNSAIDFISSKSKFKSYYGGIVVNKTSHSIQVKNFPFTTNVAPGKTSRDFGFHDTDALVIKHPTLFEGNLYNSGIIKFCDFARLEVWNDGRKDVIKPSPSTILCKLLNDYKYYTKYKTGD